MSDPIDALDTALAYLAADATLMAAIDDQLAAQHRFAVANERGVTPGWPTPSRALTLTYDGVDGGPDPIHCPDAAQERARLQARCYGATSRQAAQIYGLLTAAVTSTTARQVVTLADGRRALLYWLDMADGPTPDQDPDTRVHFIRTTVRAAVARAALT